MICPDWQTYRAEQKKIEKLIKEAISASTTEEHIERSAPWREDLAVSMQSAGVALKPVSSQLMYEPSAWIPSNWNSGMKNRTESMVDMMVDSNPREDPAALIVDQAQDIPTTMLKAKSPMCSMLREKLKRSVAPQIQHNIQEAIINMQAFGNNNHT